MLEVPVNTVVPRGGRLLAHCASSEPLDRVIFRHYRHSATVTIYDNGTVRVQGQWLRPSEYPARYAVSYDANADYSSSRQASLEIAFTQPEDAGTYSCESEMNGTIYYFEVIVLGRLPLYPRVAVFVILCCFVIPLRSIHCYQLGSSLIIIVLHRCR